MIRAKTPTWRCPECGRHFARRSKAHSCMVSSLQTHLSKASPETLETYAALERALRKLGKYDLVPTKTQINLLSRTSFGGFVVRKDSIVVGFLLARKIEDARITWALQLSPRSFAYKVPLRSARDVDEKLFEWLKEAYQVGLAAGRRDRGDKGAT